MADDAGFAGQAGLTAGNDARNAGAFHARQHTAHIRTKVWTKVIAVHYPQGGGPGMAGPPPTLDVQVMIDQIDGQMKTTPHGIVYGIQCPRNMSGNMAIINDPVVGDHGWMDVADRDISSAMAANGQAPPGSDRRHSLSDGVWSRGHDTKATPKQAIVARSDGVTIIDANGHQFWSDKDGWHFKGPILCDGQITAGAGTSDSVTLQNHTHPTAPQGPASAPTAGT